MRLAEGPGCPRLLSPVAGWLVFRAAAVLRGEGNADLPRRLDRDRLEDRAAPVLRAFRILDGGAVSEEDVTIG